MDLESGAVDRAATEMLRVLGPHSDADWQVRAGPVEWSCWATAAHVAHDLLAYAGQLAAQSATGYLPFDLTVRPGASVSDVLAVIGASAAILSNTVATSRSDVRGWHWGPTDPGGFAALGVNEILAHTHDIAQGLGISWLPPAPLAAAVLHRLFPDVPDGDPARVLLWATGRGDIAGMPRRDTWVARAAVG